VVDVLVQVEGGQHQNPRPEPGLDKPGGGLDAVHAGHADVHQDHVRIQAARLVQCLAAVGGLPGHGQVRLGFQQHPQALADEILVVGDQDVAQDTPLYKNLSVADMIYVTRSLNRRFDQRYARARLGELGIPPKRKAGKLSGGQQAQLALTLALARRPWLLVLDEPVAALDPVARHDFMATVLAAASADGVSVLLSSHVLTELERVASYLVLMSRGRIQLAGEVDDLLAAHGQASLEELALHYLRETTHEVTR
jgi:ABC-type branched-subunit amino acid transport system ATPase component